MLSVTKLAQRNTPFPTLLWVFYPLFYLLLWITLSPPLYIYGIGYAPREGEKGMHGRLSMRPTVGRLDDLQ